MELQTLEFNTKAEAGEVLERLNALRGSYGEVSMADVYELCGLRTVYTDNKYGWRSFEGARVLNGYNHKYILELPTPVSLMGEAPKPEADDQHAFGPWLRENRDRAGLSREEMGTRLGISPDYVAKLEQGTKNPSPKVRLRARKYFEQPKEDLKVGDVVMIQGISFRIEKLTLAMGQSPAVELTPMIDEMEK